MAKVIRLRLSVLESEAYRQYTVHLEIEGSPSGLFYASIPEGVDPMDESWREKFREAANAAFDQALGYIEEKIP